MSLVGALLHLLPMQSIQNVELAPTTSEGERQVYLIRHGESTSNIVDPETGIQLTSGKSLTIGLTEKGEEQATRLGSILASKIKPGTEIVICPSTATRAQQTALRIFNALSEQFKCEFDQPYDGLCELGQGPWEGLPKDANYKAELREWENRSAYNKVSHPKVKGGESYQEVAVRFLPALQTIVDKHPSHKMILIVSHHAAMNAVTLHLNKSREDLSKESTKLPSVPLENCDMIAVKISPTGDVQKAKALLHIRSIEEKNN